MVFLVASVIVLAGAVVALVLGRGGASAHLARATSTQGGSLLPEGPLTGDDARAIRFDTGFRGYRTDEVDAAMRALADRIDALEGRGPDATPAPERARTLRGPWALRDRDRRAETDRAETDHAETDRAETGPDRGSDPHDDEARVDPAAFRRPSPGEPTSPWRPDAG